MKTRETGETPTLPLQLDLMGVADQSVALGASRRTSRTVCTDDSYGCRRQSAFANAQM